MTSRRAQNDFFSAFHGLPMKPGEIMKIPLILSIDRFKPIRDGIGKESLSPTYLLTKTDEAECSEERERQGVVKMVGSGLSLELR
jgi:hypothetical protein